MAWFEQKQQLLVVLPEKDFEEYEYQQILRACKESKIGVVVTSVTVATVIGGHGEKVKPKIALQDVEIEEYAGIVFIGGLGSRTLYNDMHCHKLAKKAFEMNHIVAAIDLAVIILTHSSILQGKKVTVHPTEEKHLITAGAIYTNQPVVVDGNLVTANGIGSAQEFADVVAGAILRLSVSQN